MFTWKEDTTLTCYYAHFMGIYDTPAEERDISTLEALGFEVTNPNSFLVKEQFKAYRAVHEDNYMPFFEEMAAKHDVVAFRALPDGRIPGGVAKEVKAARDAGKLIIELPCGLVSRMMDHASTVEYLENIGER